MKNKDIYEMELHDSVIVDANLQVQRVPGGWIYTNFIGSVPTSVFVPYADSGRFIKNGAPDE